VEFRFIDEDGIPRQGYVALRWMEETNSPSPLEVRRLAASDRYGILDTEPELGFDDIALLATRICETPVALVSLVTDSRQWIPACETPLSQSVCAPALQHQGVFVIPDLTLDERTRSNPLARGSHSSASTPVRRSKRPMAFRYVWSQPLMGHPY
jgi:GAF domain-containing protein